MVKLRLIPAVLLALAAAVATAGDAPKPSTESLLSAVRERRLTQAVNVYSELSQPTNVDRYLAAYALMSLNRPLEAEPLLQAARDGGFRAWPRWPKVDQLLGRVAAYRELLPPLYGKCGAIDVHAGPRTAWSRPVLAAVPEIEIIGRSIFGADLPRVRFCLFADRKAFDRYYAALFGAPVAVSWQNGTGSFNAVVYCERDQEGRTTVAAGAPDAIGSVLHEFGHAWIASYLMERHGREWLGDSMRRPWLDEGLADYIATLREPAYLDRRATWLRWMVARKAVRPEFDELAAYSSFYEKGDPGVRYYVSALLVAELFGPQDRAPATIRKFLDEAGATGNVEQAVKTVTGKDPRKVFEEIVGRYWR